MRRSRSAPGFLAGDALNFTNANGITGSIAVQCSHQWAAGADLAERHRDAGAISEAALQSITYSFTPANGDPTGRIGTDTTRTISWVVNDGGAVSNGSSGAGDQHADRCPRGPDRHGRRQPRSSKPAAARPRWCSSMPASLSVNDIDSGGNLTGATVKVQHRLRLAGDDR